MKPDEGPRLSDLSRSIERDGQSVQVDIYKDSDWGWMLEVIDEFGNSTVWEDPLKTERDALDDALRTIEEEGIEVLIGPKGAATSP